MRAALELGAAAGTCQCQQAQAEQSHRSWFWYLNVSSNSTDVVPGIRIPVEQVQLAALIGEAIKAGANDEEIAHVSGAGTDLANQLANIRGKAAAVRVLHTHAPARRTVGIGGVALSTAAEIPGLRLVDRDRQVLPGLQGNAGVQGSAACNAIVLRINRKHVCVRQASDGKRCGETNSANDVLNFHQVLPSYNFGI